MHYGRTRLALLVVVGSLTGYGVADAQQPPDRTPVDFNPPPISDDVVARIREQDARETLFRSFPIDLDWGLP